MASIQKKEWLESKNKLAAAQKIVPGGQKAVPPASCAAVAARGATSEGAPKAKRLAAGRGAGNLPKSWLQKHSKLKKRAWAKVPRHPLVRPPNIVPERKVSLRPSAIDSTRHAEDSAVVASGAANKGARRARAASGAATLRRGRKVRVRGRFGIRHWFFPRRYESLFELV